jgi:hypothetical protein
MLLFLLWGKTAFAAGSSLSTATATSVGSTLTGQVNRSSNYYKFTISSNSVLHMRLRTGSSSQGAGFSLRNSAGDWLNGYNYYPTVDAENWGYQSRDVYVSLNAGTYYLEIKNTYSGTSYYTFKSSLIAQTTSTTKIAGYSNCYLSTALPVSMGNKIYSVSYYNETCHYYKFSLSSQQTVKFTTSVLTQGGGVRVNLYNSSGELLDRIAYSATYGSSTTYSKTLSKGTYYIGVSANSMYRYTIQTWSSALKSSQTISASNVKKTIGSSAFSLGAKLQKGNGKLSYASGNKSVAVVSSTGKVTIKGVGQATITITAAETSTYKKTVKKVTVTVVPKATSIRETIGATGSLTVRWNAVSGVSGYQTQISKSSSFSSSSYYNASSSYTGQRVTEMTGKTWYYVRVRTFRRISGVNYYSAWTSAYKIYVK